MSGSVVRGAALLALTASITCHAASFMATPVKLTVPPGANSTSLSLQNTADQPVLVQAEVAAWSQRGGEDVLTPSQDLVVSPPIFTVAPGGSQIVRIGLMKRPQSASEVTYRLFLQEVPKPAAPGEQGVAVALRLGLPVFVLPKGGVAPKLEWSARAREGAIELHVSNGGTGHAQIIECRLAAENGKVIAERSLAAYVLAGQARSWVFKTSGARSGGRLTVNAQTSAGPVSAQIVAQ